MNAALVADIAAAIGAATGARFEGARHAEAGGGCINQAVTLSGRDGRRFFVKLNRAEALDMFAAEAAGLDELRASGAIRAPAPVAHGTAGGRAFLALEWLELDGRGSSAELGRRLAALHRVGALTYGWHRDNTIGSTPQNNTQSEDWLDFLRRRRLGFQFALAARNGAPRRLPERGERLLDELEAFFPGYRPLPSLLHGDLWGGNYGYSQGAPVLFDPAVYYGDREADLAMTELFGGFGGDFYAAYREAWPLDPGYATRRRLYNLYHVLNHFNLFGGGYGEQAGRMIDGLLAEIA